MVPLRGAGLDRVRRSRRESIPRPASTTQTQGNGSLTADINVVSTVANDGDTVTLPTAADGLDVTIINKGANELQIFPASGDNLGNGLNTSIKLEVNEDVRFVGVDATNWHIEGITEIFHAEIHDADNTTAFVINAANEEYPVPTYNFP